MMKMICLQIILLQLIYILFYTTMKKSNLFEYLDAYSFAWKTDITMAIEDYFREYIEKNEKRTPSYWELAYFEELAEEYMEYADYIDEWF